MNVNSVGDLAKSLQLRRDTGGTKLELTRLTNELSSGIDSNLVDRFKGNFGPLAGVERGLVRANSFLSVIAERDTLVVQQQQALTSLRSMGDISTALLTVRESGDSVLVDSAGFDALTRLNSAVATINTQVAGKSIFSGVDTDRNAVASADIMLTAIEAELVLAGATSAADVVTVVDAWFATGADSTRLAMLAAPAETSGPQLTESEVSAASPTANDEAFRSILKGLSMSGLLARDVLSGNTEERGELARISGLRLVEAEDDLVDLQARLGASEGQIERARVEVKSETEGLQITRSELIGVDPYETAVALQAAETQLQTLFSITARLSRLTMTAYL